MSETDFNANFDDNALAIAASVADSINGIEASDVSIGSIKASSSSSVRASKIHKLSDSIRVNYKVTYNIAVLGYSGNPSGAYDHLLDELTTAVDNSDFNSYLTANAATYNAPDLSSVTSDSFSSPYYTNSNGDVPPLPNHKKRQTRYMEIGIIAGGGGFLILVWLVVGALYYCTKREDDGPVHNAAAATNAASSKKNKDGFEVVRTKEVEMAPEDKGEGVVASV